MADAMTDEQRAKQIVAFFIKAGTTITRSNVANFLSNLNRAADLLIQFQGGNIGPLTKELFTKWLEIANKSPRAQQHELWTEINQKLAIIATKAQPEKLKSTQPLSMLEMQARGVGSSFETGLPSARPLVDLGIQPMHIGLVPQSYLLIIPWQTRQELSTTVLKATGTGGMGPCVAIYTYCGNSTNVTCGLGHFDDVASPTEIAPQILQTYISQTIKRTLPSTVPNMTATIKIGVATFNPVLGQNKPIVATCMYNGIIEALEQFGLPVDALKTQLGEISKLLAEDKGASLESYLQQNPIVIQGNYGQILIQLSFSRSAKDFGIVLENGNTGAISVSDITMEPIRTIAEKLHLPEELKCQLYHTGQGKINDTVEELIQAYLTTVSGMMLSTSTAEYSQQQAAILKRSSQDYTSSFSVNSEVAPMREYRPDITLGDLPPEPLGLAKACHSLLANTAEFSTQAYVDVQEKQPHAMLFSSSLDEQHFTRSKEKGESEPPALLSTIQQSVQSENKATKPKPSTPPSSPK